MMRKARLREMGGLVSILIYRITEVIGWVRGKIKE